MQHLPFLPQKRIPYLGGPSYNEEGLENFVEHHGRRKKWLRLSDLTDKSPSSALAFVQSVLNIAIPVELFRVFGLRVNHQIFCSNGSEIDTSWLPVLLTCVARITARLSSTVKKRKVDQIGSIFDFALGCLPYKLNRNRDDVILGIACMLQFVSWILYKFHLTPKNIVPAISDKFYKNPIVLETLYHNHWCPRQIAELGDFNIIGLYYVTTLKRLSNEQSRILHAKQEEVSRCISQDIVPPVYMKPLSNLSPQHLPELRVTGSGSYTAISHVWAQGLGNPQANSLPVCQLRRLQSLSREAMQEERPEHYCGAFWIDTLCVPLKDRDRKRALALIRRTFNEASCTIVLDQAIEQLSKHTRSHEMIWGVAISDWARRLWTYEEYMVSEHRVLISCSDGLLDLRKMLQELYAPVSGATYIYDAYHMLSIPLLFVEHSRSNHSEAYHVERSLKFSAIARHASTLQTTRHEDETLCLASVMGIDTSLLAQLPAPQRMQQLLSKIRWFPAAVLFCDRFKLEEPGFRWAPASLLVDHLSHGVYFKGTVLVGQYREVSPLKGFITSLPGYELTLFQSRLKGTTILKVQGASSRMLFYWEPAEDPRAKLLRDIMTNNYDTASKDWIPGVFENPLRLIVLDDTYLGSAVLVESIEQHNGIEVVKYIARIHIVPMDDLGINEADYDLTYGNLVHGKVLPKTHKWCVT